MPPLPALFVPFAVLALLGGRADAACNPMPNAIQSSCAIAASRTASPSPECSPHTEPVSVDANGVQGNNNAEPNGAPSMSAD